MPYVQAASPAVAGRYLVEVGGCNDCHTPGFARANGVVPESRWLLGSPVGFRGPWGTTYPPNLRLSAKDMAADDWVTILRARRDKPPMPWPSVHAMSDRDLRAVFAYIKSLPVTGDPARRTSRRRRSRRRRTSASPRRTSPRAPARRRRRSA